MVSANRALQRVCWARPRTTRALSSPPPGEFFHASPPLVPPLGSSSRSISFLFWLHVVSLFWVYSFPSGVHLSCYFLCITDAHSRGDFRVVYVTPEFLDGSAGRELITRMASSMVHPNPPPLHFLFLSHIFATFPGSYEQWCVSQRWTRRTAWRGGATTSAPRTAPSAACVAFSGLR